MKTWIKNLFYRSVPERASRRSGKTAPRIFDKLEERTMFSAVWLDFGFALPDGQITVSDTQMRDPALNGPTRFGQDNAGNDINHALISLTRTIQNQNIDLNTDGNADQIDALLLADQVMTNVRRIFEPFNIQVFQNNARNLDDVRDRLSGSSNDAYIFVFGDDPAANPAWGWALLDRDDTRVDLGLNRFDNVAFAFADEIIRVRTPAQVAPALSFVAAHEAGHTFGLKHTRADRQIEGGLLMGTPIGATDLRRFDVVNHIARFPMPLEDNSRILEDSYSILTAAVGAGTAPNRTYVSGTGLHDRITITPNGPFKANVSVEAFRDFAFTQLERSHSYVISAGQDVIIEAGVGNDLLIIDGGIDARFHFRGGADIDGVLIKVQGGPTDVTADRANARRAAVFYNEFGENEQLFLQGDRFSSVNVISTNTSLTIRDAGAVTIGNGQLNGLAQDVILEGGIAQTNLRINAVNEDFGNEFSVFADRVHFFRPYGTRDVRFGNNTLASITIDAGIGADTILVNGTPSLPFNPRQQDVAKVVLNTGPGRDRVLVQATTVPLRVNDGGGGDEIWVGRITTFEDPDRNVFSLNNNFVVDRIMQSVHVTSVDSLATLNVVDTGSDSSRNIGLDITGQTGNVTGLTPSYFVGGGKFGKVQLVSTAISFDNKRLLNLNIYGGSNGNTFEVYDTMVNGRRSGRLGQDIASTSLFTGTFSDTVNIRGTTGALTVNTQGGFDTITVGTPDSALRRFGLDRVRGNVAVHGDINGITTLVVNDRQGSQSRPFVLYDVGLDIGGGVVISFDKLFNLAVLGGVFGNNFVVENTPVLAGGFGQVELYTGAGSDSVLVKRTSQELLIEGEGGQQHSVVVGTGATTLDDIRKTVRLADGNSLQRSLVVSDAGNTLPRQVQLGLDGVNSGTFRYLQLGSAWSNAGFNYAGGSGDDIIYFEGRPGTQTVINPGAGDDYVYASSLAGTLENLGTMRVSDSAGIDTLFISDANGTEDRTFTLEQFIFPSVSTTGTQVLYQGVDLVAVTGGSGNNTYEVKYLPTDISTELIGGAGIETLVGPDVTADWLITDAGGRHALLNSSVPEFYVVFSQIENIQAGNGNDRFIFEPDAVPIAGNIDGGGGVNTLDYSAFIDDVYVNLPEKQATLVDGLVTSFTNVIGGAGNDILVGNGGNRLFGGAGRDLLIAGQSSSQLYGGSGEDLLVGGTTDYDNGPLILASIRDFWSRTDLTYAERVAALVSGNGTPRLDADTVHSNGGGNLLVGVGGGMLDEMDLYFSTLGLDTLDADLDEIVFL